jgi:hypothetical protein
MNFHSWKRPDDADEDKPLTITDITRLLFGGDSDQNLIIGNLHSIYDTTDKPNPRISPLINDNITDYLSEKAVITDENSSKQKKPKSEKSEYIEKLSKSAKSTKSESTNKFGKFFD